jgi:hypothetical protein
MKKHVEILGWINAVIGVLYAVIGVFTAGLLLLLAPLPDERIGSLVMVAVGLGIGCFMLLLAVPTFVAGVGLLKGKTWARTLAIILGVLALFNVPIGTMIGIYTFWVLTQDETTKAFAAPAPA